MIRSRATWLLRRLGYDLVHRDQAFERDELSMLRRVEPFTMTSRQRVVGLIDAVKYVHANRVPGAFVECGVWRGGSMMAAALTLLELGDTSRELFLFDTFQGMTPPTSKDSLFDGTPASEVLRNARRDEAESYWCVADQRDVHENMLSTGYPSAKIHLVPGQVEETIPAHAPDAIALLRLDTDWYESTRHELVNLYGRLARHGVLIIDDYGHWQGARRAVDEFLATLDVRPFMTRLDYTGRLLIKPSP
jgi:hypothetical protein